MRVKDERDRLRSVGILDDVDVMLNRIDAEIERRGPPAPRLAAYVGLHVEPGVEVSGKGYARQPLNEQQAVFQAAGNWGTVSSIGIYDDEGVLLAELALTASPRRLLKGETLQVQVEFGQMHIYGRDGFCIDCGQRGGVEWPDLSAAPRRRARRVT